MNKSKIYIIIFCCIICIPFAHSQIPTNGLIAHYPFKGNANDKSGNSNNGTVFGAELTADRFGNLNSAYNFDGVDDYIFVRDSTSLRPDSAVTVSAWVYIEDNSTRHTILVKRNQLYDIPYNSWGISSSAIASTQTWQASNSRTVSVNSQSDLELNKWVHLLEVYDGNTLKLYVDGELEGTETYDSPMDMEYSQMGMYIGSGARISGQYTKGKIDDIRIYSYALSSMEIEALYTEENPALSIATDELKSNNINIYPNPANNFINIQINEFSPADAYTLEIKNTLGQTISVQNINKKNFIVDLSAWSAKGIYFLQVKNRGNNTIEARKFIIQ